MSSQQIKSCIRRILTEHGNTDDVRATINNECENCTKEFKFTNELCLKCLSKSFELIHHFTLVDGIKAFSQVATLIKDGDEWAELKKAKRNPVVLIVDEVSYCFFYNIKYQLHAVSHIQQDRQRELSIRHTIPCFLPNSGGIVLYCILNNLNNLH